MERSTIRTVALVAGLALAVALTPSTSFARFPTPAKEQESIEESIGRLQYDESRGKKMIAANEKKIAKLVGAKFFAAYKNGDCPRLACKGVPSAAKARKLLEANLRMSRQLTEVVQEKRTLMAMVEKMKEPLAANTSAQPGVSRAPAMTAAPDASATNSAGTPDMSAAPAGAAPASASAMAPAATSAKPEAPAMIVIVPGAKPGAAPDGR